MLMYCVDQWDKNKARLEQALTQTLLFGEFPGYLDLVRMVVQHVLNDDDAPRWKLWDAAKVHEIDDGDYQGTLLYLIPRDTYQPGAADYLMTCVNYGSCSGCDTLLSIEALHNEPYRQVQDLMVLCLHLIQSMIRPYKHDGAWANSEVDDGEES